ncbi:MAG: S-layer homology domain-containing protein [Oscillospiraceae bacterium]|nr:S-layer homology domain-containing protein [Oscillospiraceae bacterium]
MKKRIMSVLLSIVLLLGSAAAANADINKLPKDVWKYGNPYFEALEGGDVGKILSTGEAYINYLKTLPLNEHSADQLFRVYNKRLELRIFEEKGDWEKAKDNAEEVVRLGEYLNGKGLGYEDAVIAARAHIEVLTPLYGVYAASYTRSDNYGSNIAAESGSLYGSILNGYFAGKSGYYFSGEGSQVSVYVELGAETAADYSSYINGILDSGKVCQINLNFKNKGDTAREIVSGKLDSNIDATASFIGSLGKPVLVRIGGEMNIWGGDKAVAPKDFIAAYRRVAARLREKAPLAELVWSPMQNGKWNESLEDYWPGDDCVDWVGLSLYYNLENTDSSRVSWVEFSKTYGFTDPLRKARNVCELALAHGKPVAITEGGSNKNGTGGEATAAKLTAKMFSTVNMAYPNVKAMILFDRDIKEAGTVRDFSMQSPGVYRTAILDAVHSNPALISSGEKSAATWVPAETFSEKADEVLLGATGFTYWDNELKVAYALDGEALSSSDASPNYCSLSASSLAKGAHKLTVTLTGSHGFKVTKSYVVRRSELGTVSITAGVYPFTDLKDVKWNCAPYVEAAFDAGLVKGVSATKYGPKNDLQIAQAVTLAARIYAEAHGEEAPPSKGSPWYKPAYDYCVEKGIIDPAKLPISRLTEKCTRFEMVEILDKAIPASRWQGATEVPDGYIPDLSRSDEHGELVYRWYAAGIVSGDGKHRFNGPNNINRAEVAKILCTITGLA